MDFPADSEPSAIQPEVLSRGHLLRDMLDLRGIDAAILASQGNFFYLTNYLSTSWGNTARPAALLFPRSDRPLAIVSAGEQERLRFEDIDADIKEYVHLTDIEVDGHHELGFMGTIGDIIGTELRARGAHVVGIELSSHFMPSLSPGTYDDIRMQLPNVRFVDISPLLRELRARKSAQEVRNLRRAAEILATTYAGFERQAYPGLTEVELAHLFMAEAAKVGADHIKYLLVIASVENASVGGPTSRRWEPNHLLMIDSGIVVAGYWADYCRIYGGSGMSNAQLHGYQEVQRLLQPAYDAAKPGMPIADLAALLRGRTTIAGSEPPVGRSGHGIGIDLTEPPSIAVQERGSLESGMVLCFEPSRYVPGVGYITVEEEMVVTNTGVERLSPTMPTEPLVLGN